MDVNSVNSYKTNYSKVGIKLSDFKILKELGKGSYGTVYTVRSYIDDNIYVMKKMELNNLTDKQQKECYREVSILKKVSHQNIIKYYSSFLDCGNLYIIMEYAEGGDLYSLIKHYKRHNKHFDEFDIWRIAFDILNGLEYLHKNNIIHRDIKCLNLFITKDKHIKIGDLGVSTIVSNINALHCTRVGTPLYLSPELVKQVPYDFKVDIWSCGCSLYHLANLDPPFLGDNLIVLGNNIVKGKQKPLPQQYSEDMNKFIERMLSKRPEKRPSAKEAIEMISKDIMEKIKIARENNVGIKSRPFSSVGNKIVTYNKEEIIKDASKKEKKELMPIEEENKKKGNENGNNNNGNKDNKKDNIKDLENKEKPLTELLKQSEKENKQINQNNNNNILVDHGDVNVCNKKELMILLNNNNSVNTYQLSKNIINNCISNTPIPKANITNNNCNSNINNNKNNQNINSFRSKNPTLSSNILPLNPTAHSKNYPSKLIEHSSKDNPKTRLPSSFNSLILPQPLMNIEKVENFIINSNTNSKPTHTVITSTSSQPVSSHKNLINHYRNSSLSPKENITEIFKFPDLTSPKHTLETIADNKVAYSRRIFSSKLARQKTPTIRTRPLTASSTKIFSSKIKTTKSSRPVTAFDNRRCWNENKGGGIINININLYNVDMNQRFLDPNLNPLKQGNELSMLMNSQRSKDRVNEIQIGNCGNGFDKTVVNLKEIAENNNNEFVFNKIIKTLEHTRKGSKKLTINDFEENNK